MVAPNKRDAVERRLKGEKPGILDSRDVRKGQLRLMVERFPSAATMSQPGFASLAKEIEAGYRKAPDEPGRSIR